MNFHQNNYFDLKIKQSLVHSRQGIMKKYLNVHPNHAHEDAESIEHILTPRLEKELITLINDNEGGS